MKLQELLSQHIKTAVQENYNVSLEEVEFQATRKDFEGDVTVVVFSMLRTVKGNPVQIGETIGQYLVTHVDEVSKFNVVKGFLNLVLSDQHYLNFFNTIENFSTFGTEPTTADAMMVEYASPNTNKPLHLGHVRNVLLGYSVAEILKASGKKVYKTQIINDRGIHICKSMLAWQRYGNGETPQSSGLKGDHLVGKYYVIYNSKYQEELNRFNSTADMAYDLLLSTAEKEPKVYFDFQKTIQKETNYSLNSNILWAVGGLVLADHLLKNSEDDFIPNALAITSLIVAANSIDKNEFFKTNINAVKKIVEPDIKKYNNIPVTEDNKYVIKKEMLEKYKKQSPIIQDAQEMLRKWEAGDDEVVSLWKKMNGWVYEGFDATYENIGVDFDKNYYESDTYLLGKDFIEQGLQKGVFEKDPDGSVWCDLTDEGLDRKIVLRSDGTAVYMTQDIGTAIQRVKDFPDVNGMIYTVGNEQDYHFKVLFLILKKLGFSWAENLYHLSYGMVDLPSGKMKSREGTVVDADDLIDDMAATAKKISEELGKIDDFSEEEKENLYKTIGLGALKYYILKVDPRKRILFNPEESVDFQGNTGPFIQYTYARIQSILRKAAEDKNNTRTAEGSLALHEKEKELIKILQQFPDTVQLAAQNYSPALIANYTYDLVKEFNSFYQNVPIFNAEHKAEVAFRVALCSAVGEVIKTAFSLLGIEVPNRM
ncbi:MAG: arginine--tRNA ligase [Flavobacteriaceae bacterium]|nr:arginine--tRNA ligase [Flavobacteriaceae bacterium]|tara:strand:+ start:15564 stop:17687 length:2124 start_codon:yes stop_codon:yes gene_type:complete